MDILVEIICTIIESLILLVIFEALHNNKHFIKQHKIKSILFCSLYISANYLVDFYVNKSYHTILLSIFCILILAYITKIRIIDSTIIFFVFLIIIAITEYSIQTIEMIVLGINLNQLSLNSTYLFYFILSAKSLQIIFTIILFKLSHHIRKFKLFEKDGIFFSNIIIQTGIFSILIFIINFSIFNIENTKMYNCFIFIVYFIFVIFQLKGLKEYKRIVNIEAKYKIQEHQLKNMEEMLKIIRQEKHDFANHVNVIWGLCSLNKQDTVEKIKHYVMGISDKIHSSFKYIDTGNDYLSALLSIKGSYAIKNNINFDIMIDEPFTSIEIKENDLISIISNIIDNAFEAFEGKSTIEDKEITIDSFSEDNKFFIEISNNGDMIPEDIQNKIFDRGFSTKTEKSQDHGFGLYIIKQLIKENNGNISLESTPEATKFLIEFKMKELDK